MNRIYRTTCEVDGVGDGEGIGWLCEADGVGNGCHIGISSFGGIP